MILKLKLRFKGDSLKISRAKKPKVKTNINQYVNGATKIFVGGIPSNVTADEFAAYFTKYGSIKEMSLPLKNKFKCVNKGHGFVNFKHAESAKDAVEGSGSHFMRGKYVS